MRGSATWQRIVAGVMVMAALAGGRARAQGVILPGAGAAHLSMAGASTASGVDALGALYWNPAAISGLKHSEVVIGGALLLPETYLGSSINAGAFGPLGPATGLSGRTRSDSGLGLTSGLGVVYKPEGSPLTFGLAINTLAGGSVNFPGDPGNPILAPTGPFNNFVLGPQAASMTVVSIAPTVSYQVTDRLAFGVSPIVDVSVVSFDPAFFGPANDANGDGLSSFPTGSHTRPFWGGGFRAGLTYRVTDDLTAGFSYTSPQWFEKWKFNAKDEVGNPFFYTTRFTLPAIYSAGLTYTGIPGLTLSSDVRWFDYRTTQLLGEPPVAGGAGWDSIWAVALGARYQVNERVAVSAGYLYNENPVPANLALFNTQLPAVTEHTLCVGGTVQLNDSIALSLAYNHGFENSVGGAIFPLRGTNTTITSSYDAIAFGLHIRFGGCAAACPSEPLAVATPQAVAHPAMP